MRVLDGADGGAGRRCWCCIFWSPLTAQREVSDVRPLVRGKRQQWPRAYRPSSRPCSPTLNHAMASIHGFFESMNMASHRMIEFLLRRRKRQWRGHTGGSQRCLSPIAFKLIARPERPISEKIQIYLRRQARGKRALVWMQQRNQRLHNEKLPVRPATLSPVNHHRRENTHRILHHTAVWCNRCFLQTPGSPSGTADNLPS